MVHWCRSADKEVYGVPWHRCGRLSWGSDVCIAQIMIRACLPVTHWSPFWDAEPCNTGLEGVAVL